MNLTTFTTIRDDAVSAWGEVELINQIRKWLGDTSPRTPFGIGDDCAVIPGTNFQQLLTVDPVVFNQHFDDTVAPRNVGMKLLKRNLSDIAAMGGAPTAAVVSLLLDPMVDSRWLEEFYRGLAACARKFRIPIVGGDITRADKTFAASLTLLGAATGPRVLTRDGAAIGDHIYVTGELGGLGEHHFRFTPRLAEGAWLVARPEVKSMMDVSDGIAKDIFSLVPPRAYPAIAGEDLPRMSFATIETALCRGEDYELLFSVSADADLARFEADWKAALPKTLLTRIGSFVRGATAPEGMIDFSTVSGYQHLL